MKFYFGDTFFPGEGPFIEKMFARQSKTSQPLFTYYIEGGQINLKPGMPGDQMEYLDCANPKYRIRPSIGLNRGLWVCLIGIDRVVMMSINAPTSLASKWRFNKKKKTIKCLCINCIPS